MKRVTLIRHGESAYNHFRKAALQTFNLRQLVKYDPGAQHLMFLKATREAQHLAVLDRTG